MSFKESIKNRMMGLKNEVGFYKANPFDSKSVAKLEEMCQNEEEIPKDVFYFEHLENSGWRKKVNDVDENQFQDYMAAHSFKEMQEIKKDIRTIKACVIALTITVVSWIVGGIILEIIKTL